MKLSNCSIPALKLCTSTSNEPSHCCVSKALLLLLHTSAVSPVVLLFLFPEIASTESRVSQLL